MFTLRLLTAGHQGARSWKTMSGCVWNAMWAMAHELHQTAWVWVCLHLYHNKPLHLSSKSFIYGNGTATLLWALLGSTYTQHKHSHIQTHTWFRASHWRAGRLNSWHRLYPLHGLPNTHMHSAATGFVSSPHLTEWWFLWGITTFEPPTVLVWPFLSRV